MILWSLVLGAHLLAMTLWTGGMAYALVVLRPSLAALPPAERMALHGETLRRFFRLVYFAMPLVLLTGWSMVFGVYGGFANLPWPVNVMQLLGLVMAAVFLALVFGPYRRFRAQPTDAAAAAIRRLIHVNLGLGAVVIVVASFAQWGS